MGLKKNLNEMSMKSSKNSILDNIFKFRFEIQWCLGVYIFDPLHPFSKKNVIR